MERDKYYLTITQTIAQQSSCQDIRVGCLIVVKKGVYVGGYNSLPNDVKCHTCVKHQGHCVSAIHAEINALMHCCKSGISTKNAEVYLTHCPCWNCSLAFIAAGIKKIVYLKDYVDNRGNQIELLRENGILVEKGEI